MFAEVLKICEVSSSSANTPDQTVYPHVTKYTSVMQMHHIQVWLDGRIKKKKKEDFSGVKGNESWLIVQVVQNSVNQF